MDRAKNAFGQPGLMCKVVIVEDEVVPMVVVDEEGAMQVGWMRMKW